MAGEMRMPRAGTSTPLAVALALGVAGSGLGVAWMTADDGPGAVVSGRVTLDPEVRDALAAEGRVVFTGTPPAGEPIDMSADPYCREQHDEPVVDRPVRVGDAGGVQAVLVHVRNAPNGAGDQADETLLDQVGCLYNPEAVAVRVGETLVVRNSDETLHNVRVTPELNRGFNLGQPMKGIESRRSFGQAEIGIPVRCDIHGWMHSTIHVLDHGFFAITGMDGSFSLPELPSGEYEVEAWHRTLGSATQTVRVVAGEPVEIAFEFGG